MKFLINFIFFNNNNNNNNHDDDNDNDNVNDNANDNDNNNDDDDNDNHFIEVPNLLAEHRSSTIYGDSIKPTTIKSNQITSNPMLAFGERGKPEYQ